MDQCGRKFTLAERQAYWPQNARQSGGSFPAPARSDSIVNSILRPGYGRGSWPAAPITSTSAYHCVLCGLIGFSLFCLRLAFIYRGADRWNKSTGSRSGCS